MSHSTQWVSALKGIIGETNVIQDPDQLKGYAVDGLAPRAVVTSALIASSMVAIMPIRNLRHY